MPSKNKIIVIGHVGRDAEWVDVGSGFCKFSVAVTESWKVGEEWKEHTEWFDVTVNGAAGKRLVGKIKKGHLVDVDGSVGLNRWQGKDGTEMATLRIKAWKVLLLTKVEKSAAKVDDSDDLPF